MGQNKTMYALVIVVVRINVLFTSFYILSLYGYSYYNSYTHTELYIYIYNIHIIYILL